MSTDTSSTSTDPALSGNLAASLRGIIDATSAATAADATQAGVVFRATGVGDSGVATDIQIRSHQVQVDEPPSLGGVDSAPNPVETALAGLLSCQVVSYRFWAAKLNIPLDDVRIETEGDLDVRGFLGLRDGVRPGLGAVRVKVRLTGSASPEQYEQLRLAVDQHCPVLDLFANPTPVSTELVTG
jgi:uncharacterized OsmC-like protein